MTGENMSFPYRKTLLIIGDGLEIAGNITLAAAAIFGVLSVFIVLCAAESKSKPSRQPEPSQGNTTNIFIVPVVCSNDRGYHHCHYDNSEFYHDLLVSSAICSIIGIVLAIHFQIYWVAIFVAGLWIAATALSYMGRTLINYALTLQEPALQADDSTLTPSAPRLEENDATLLPVATHVSDDDIDYYNPAIARWAGYAQPL
jgi:hypothetical protein